MTVRLRALRPDSIRVMILVLAVLATLLPSFATTWISYLENRRVLGAKATEELRGASAQTARELDLWVKERFYELRVFASSYEVTENVPYAARPASRERLAEYLHSVHERFGDYDDLRILNSNGRVLASGGEPDEPAVLPVGWQSQMIREDFLLGAPYWDAQDQAPEILLAVPIRLGRDELLGTMAATVDLRSLAATMRRFSPGEAGLVSLLTAEGKPIISSHDAAAAVSAPRYAAATLVAGAAADGEPSEISTGANEQVLGSVRRVAGLDWLVAADIPVRDVYRELARLRNSTLAVVVATLLLVGGFGYALGLFIVRPLDRLTKAAAKVAAGNLNVDLAGARGEIGYLTEVFNNMIARLRESRKELERLSVTDALTGLSNRRKMTEVLSNEVLRSQRLKHSFAVMMADVDNFKAYNDTHGHPAGDELLRQVAAVVREETRDVDLVARYGGEEFLVLLPETTTVGATDLADRIRRRLVRSTASRVTLSFGVAEFPLHGNSGERLIEVADAALYEAKRSGRNRVVTAGGVAMGQDMSEAIKVARG